LLKKTKEEEEASNLTKKQKTVAIMICMTILTEDISQIFTLSEPTPDTYTRLLSGERLMP
jgi:hypothetical protein